MNCLSIYPSVYLSINVSFEDDHLVIGDGRGHALKERREHAVHDRHLVPKEEPASGVTGFSKGVHLKDFHPSEQCPSQGFPSNQMVDVSALCYRPAEGFPHEMGQTCSPRSTLCRPGSTWIQGPAFMYLRILVYLVIYVYH